MYGTWSTELEYYVTTTLKRHSLVGHFITWYNPAVQSNYTVCEMKTN